MKMHMTDLLITKQVFILVMMNKIKIMNKVEVISNIDKKLKFFNRKNKLLTP